MFLLLKDIINKVLKQK